ncbi:MAG: hypothetical protein SPL12_08690 [Bacteroidales bacterium]|nr:hypothetical protein [Bacteroidales bacterium]
MKRYSILLLLTLFAAALQAQENPAPVPPNYERIDKETRRWFGEYRYRSLVRRFERGDTSLTVDHYRCLYYGAGQRGDTTYTLSAVSRRAGNAGWLQFMGLHQAVWSSGNGSDTLPFHVASYADARFMRDDTRDPDVCCSLMGKPLRRRTAARMEPLVPRSGRDIFGARDSVAMVQLGVLPTAEQRRLFDRAASRDHLAVDSLRRSYEGRPNGSLWFDLQLAEFDGWSSDEYELNLHSHRGDTSLLLAEYYLRMAKESFVEAEKYSRGYRYQKILHWCDTIERFWPASVAAQHAAVLRSKVLTGDVRLKDDHRPYIVPFATGEWALATLWHRRTDRVYLRLTPMDSVVREHPKVLKAWTMAVTQHPDLLFHEAYVYLPPMSTGRYLLWASADSLFRSYEAQEVVFSDRYLMADKVGRGVVMDSRTGKPIQGFEVHLQYEGHTVATTRTDPNGCFAFEVPRSGNEYRYTLYAPYKGVDLARSSQAYPSNLWHFELDTARYEDDMEEDDSDEEELQEEIDWKDFFEKKGASLYLDSAACDSLWFSYGCWDYTAGEMKYTPAVDAELSVERLLPPTVHRLNHTMLSHDAEHSIDSAEFERRFPGFAYSPYINNTGLWPLADSETLRQRFAPARRHAFALPPMSPDGVYRVTVRAGEKSRHTTLYQGRMPITTSHVDAWAEHPGPIALGDTIRIHLASWQKDVQAVVQLEVNGRVTDVRRVSLHGKELVLEYPVDDVEGIVLWKVASVWHGEPSNAAIMFVVGPHAGDYEKQFNSEWYYIKNHLLDWSRFYDEQRLRQAPQVVYPDRQQFVPSVWRYLDLRDKGLRGAHLYCPGEYNRWRNFSYMWRIFCR